MTNYQRGRRAEWKTMRRLEAQGYTCYRTAGSHGDFDVIARGVHGSRWVQVKTGGRKPPATLLDGLRSQDWPIAHRPEVWWWPPRASEPVIYV